MSSTNGADSEEEDICPKRFGLNYDPPSIVLEYLQLSTGKLFHRHIGLRRLRASSDPARVAEKLRAKNQSLLAEDKVSFEQIVTLISKLQASLAAAGKLPSENGKSPAAAKPAATSPPAAAAAAAVAAADDVPKGAQPAETPSPSKAAEDDGAKGSPTAANAPRAGRRTKNGDAAVEADDEMDEEVAAAAGAEDMATKNLNALSDAELARHKAKMDVIFFKHQKKPGDAGYIYDVQVDYPEGEEECGWDSDGSDEEVPDA
eukprot:TRINITY_DN124713_c0_g1_i1.p1 TRINITY_DN124713_c0_g1~~TRINITY_DN124713_c0_g1_i1.p1  ORF type:complete len:260 (+),score=82.48 TRINITY_DN124713_c0_g1_i1:129-908(+)